MVNIRFKTGDFKHIHGGKMKLWKAPNSKYIDNELFTWVEYGILSQRWVEGPVSNLGVWTLNCG